MERIQRDRILECQEALGDLADDRSSHHAPTSAELARGSADDRDTGVLRRLGGEVRAEGYLVAYMPRGVAVATTT